jgi:hypothetical protein
MSKKTITYKTNYRSLSIAAKMQKPRQLLLIVGRDYDNPFEWLVWSAPLKPSFPPHTPLCLPLTNKKGPRKVHDPSSTGPVHEPFLDFKIKNEKEKV